MITLSIQILFKFIRLLVVHQFVHNNLSANIESFRTHLLRTNPTMLQRKKITPDFMN